jgi:putative membrane protein
MDGVSFASLWRFDPLPLGATLAAVLLYGVGTGPLRGRLTDGPFPAGKAALFYTGMGILTVMFMSPLHTLGEFFLLSAHMLTMMLVIFVVAPLVLLGLPGWLVAPVALHPVIKPVLRFLTWPAVNLVHFNLAFLIVHIPAALKLLMFSTDVLHYLTYFAILSSALLMWWPVINPLPQDLPGPGFKGQLIYLVVLLFSHNPFSSVFSYASGLIYPWYAEAPRVLGLSPVQDQNVAGVLMGVVYMTALLIAAAVVFARWFERGRSNTRDSRAAAARPPEGGVAT